MRHLSRPFGKIFFTPAVPRKGKKIAGFSQAGRFPLADPGQAERGQRQASEKTAISAGRNGRYVAFGFGA